MKAITYAILFTILFLQMIISSSCYSSESSEGQLFASINQIQPLSTLIINQTQTWYGDFIVNDVDTVIIENCNFTVENGDIWVYGNLTVKNSSLTIRRNTMQKSIWVIGNLTFLRSVILGRVIIFNCLENSLTRVEQSTIRWVFWSGGVVRILNSTFRQAEGSHGTVTIVNSEGKYSAIQPDPSTYLLITNTNITERFSIYIDNKLPDSLNKLEIPSTNVDFWELRDDDIELNVTVTNSYMPKWYLSVSNNNASELIDFALANSTIEHMSFYVTNTPMSSYNLALKPGYIHYQDIYVDNNFNVTLHNSTINNWGFSVRHGTFHFWDSNFSSLIWYDSNVSIVNSEMTYLATRDFSGNLTISNVTTNTLMMGIDYGSMDFVLNEGYQEHLNFYNAEQGFNITLIQSKVNHWGIETGGNSTVNIYNSTITGLHPEPLFSGLNVLRNSSVYIYNSNLTGAKCGVWAPSLTIVNSTMGMLYVYDDANVTAINSSIGTIITDPPYIELINSKIVAEINLPLALDSEYITSSIENFCEISLPSELQRASKYLKIVTTYDDYFEAQIRIHYDEAELYALGINEADLKMYFLDDESTQWSLCTSQGVNVIDNYVWANATRFSYFVIGAQASTPTPASTSGGGGSSRKSWR